MNATSNFTQTSGFFTLCSAPSGGEADYYDDTHFWAYLWLWISNVNNLSWLDFCVERHIIISFSIIEFCLLETSFIADGVQCRIKYHKVILE